MINIKFIAVILLSSSFLSINHLQAQETYKGKIGKTFAQSKEWWPEPIKPPAGAPNIIWILLDDVGFGASSTFGGVIKTPMFDSLADNGLRYTNFHTTGICAPSRAALLTGRNQHSVHMGGFAHTNSSAGFPGWDGKMQTKDGTIAEILRESGYNTFAVGKFGLTPDLEATDAGPFDRWPLGKGFEHFFGFLESETDQYKPNLVEDNNHITPNGRHFSEQITDKAISYISRQKKAAPNKPFFLYYAPAGTHSPHQVDSFWSNQYKGQFDDGWDVFREKVFANQKRMGIIPANAILPERNPLVKEWNTLPADQKKLYARFMEVYAGYLTYTDFEISRIIHHLQSINQLENTMIFVMIGDNGASKEGSEHGTISGFYGSKTGPRNTPEKKFLELNENGIAKIGGPDAFTNYPTGWAQAANTPFKYWKQDANSEGGTRNPLVVFYPKGIKDKGGIRKQYGHLIDLLPTTLEYIGLKAPKYIKSVKQDSIQGISLVYSFTDAKAASKHTQQYYYIFGSRSIYKDGWKAETLHHPNYFDEIRFMDAPPISTESNYDKDVWELYNLNEDFNERIDLAKKYPEKLKALKALFDADAKKYNVYPFIDLDDTYKGRVHKNDPAEKQ